MSTTETKWPTAVELANLLYDKFTVSTGHGSSQDAIGFAYAVLAQWGNALPRISADGLQPSMDEVMGLAKAFGLEVNSPDALMWLVMTALASWGDTPAPAPPPHAESAEPGEVAELVEFLTPTREQAGAISLDAFRKLRRAASLLQQQEAELAALRGVPVAELDDQHREAVYQAVAEALGSGAYDCLRVWEAWGVGTMGPDDFVPVAEDSDRVAEIADAAIEAIRAIPAPQAGVEAGAGEVEESKWDNGFMAGVCVALVTVTLHYDSVIWKEIVQSVGTDSLLNYAANVNPVFFDRKMGLLALRKGNGGQQ
jgi:hypothetical protein